MERRSNNLKAAVIRGKYVRFGEGVMKCSLLGMTWHDYCINKVTAAVIHCMRSGEASQNFSVDRRGGHKSLSPAEQKLTIYDC